jgi:fucose 4-O-acetylase-like acetyltransferase
VKALLIFCVLLGHFADYYTEVSGPLRMLFFFIYTFHMPLFIFISGLFIKSAINGERFQLEKVASFLLLYGIMKIMMFVMNRFLFGNADYPLDFTSEDSVPWYLFAMAGWMCIVYLLKPIKPTYVLGFSILIGLLVGYDNDVNDTYVASRILVFLPFFLLGYYMDFKKLGALLQNHYVKRYALGFLIVFALILIFGLDFVYKYRPFLSGRNSYADAGQPLLGPFYRLFFYGVTLVTSIAIMSIMPNRKTIFSYIGERTLQIYFFHRFFLWVYHYFEINNWLEKWLPHFWLVLYMLLAIPLTLFLSWKPIGLPLKPILGIRFDKLLRKNARA